MYTTGYYQHNKHNKHPFMHNQTTHPQTNVQCFNFSGLHFYTCSRAVLVVVLFYARIIMRLQIIHIYTVQSTHTPILLWAKMDFYCVVRVVVYRYNVEEKPRKTLKL